MTDSDSVTLLILLAGLLTYLTRAGGYLILMQVPQLHYRLEAALNAVPVAVLTALVAPSAVAHGWPETVALLVAGLVALRFSGLWVIGISLALLVGLRQLA